MNPLDEIKSCPKCNAKQAMHAALLIGDKRDRKGQKTLRIWWECNSSLTRKGELKQTPKCKAREIENQKKKKEKEQ